MRAKKEITPQISILKTPNNPFYYLETLQMSAWALLNTKCNPLFKITDVGVIILSFLGIHKLRTVTQISKAMFNYRDLSLFSNEDAVTFSQKSLYHYRFLSTNRFKVCTDGTPCFQLKGDNLLQGECDIAFNTVNKQIASRGCDGKAIIRDARTHKFLYSLIGHTRIINCITFSSDGMRIATGSDDTMLKIWESQTGRCLRTFKHPESVSCVEFSSNSAIIASVSSNTIRIWDIATGKNIGKFQGRPRKIIGITMHSDGNQVIAAASDGSLESWNIHSGKQTSAVIMSAPSPFIAIDINSDRKKIVGITQDNKLRIFDEQCHQIYQKKLGGTETAKTISLCGDFIMIGFENGRTRQYAYAHFTCETLYQDESAAAGQSFSALSKR